MRVKPGRTVEYLRTLAHYPLAVIQDNDGEQWTWSEGRSAAVAVRGQLEGLPPSTILWPDPTRWRGTMRLALAENRRGPGGTSCLYPLEALRAWAGDPWTPPYDPCPHCHGTGRAAGTSSDMARPGAVREGVLVDRNLLARVLAPFEPGSVVVDAIRNNADDPIRIRSTDGETRAVLARMRGSTEGMETFEDVEAARASSLSLGGESGRLAPVGAPTILEAKDETGNEIVSVLPRPSARRLLGARSDEVCPHCGGEAGGGLCESCGRET